MIISSQKLHVFQDLRLQHELTIELEAWFNWESNLVGYSQKNWWDCSPLPKTHTLFMTKICDIPCSIYDLTKNLSPYLWPDTSIKPVSELHYNKFPSSDPCINREHNRPFLSLMCLCFKTSLSAKPFIWKWVLNAVSFLCKSKSFSWEWFCT